MRRLAAAAANGCGVMALSSGPPAARARPNATFDDNAVGAGEACHIHMQPYTKKGTLVVEEGARVLSEFCLVGLPR